MDNQLFATLAGLFGFVLVGVFMARGTMSAVFNFWLSYAAVVSVTALATGVNLTGIIMLLLAPWMMFAFMALLVLFIFGA